MKPLPILCLLFFLGLISCKGTKTTNRDDEAKKSEATVETEASLTPRPNTAGNSENSTQPKSVVPIPTPLKLTPDPTAPPDRKKMMDYLVMVEGNVSAGSGSVIQLKGNSLIVTNAHVLSGNSAVTFRRLDSTSIKPGTFGFAQGCDLAVIAQESVTGGLEAMLEVDRNVNIGDEVVVLGNSQGIGVVTEIPGKVTGLGPNLVEIDAKFVLGNSGSPIVHVKTGKVIGIATFATLRKLDALSKDSQFTEIRRFGYRLDTVAQWEFRTWETFQKEGAVVTQIVEKSENLIALVREVYASGGVPGRLGQNDQRNNPLNRYVGDFLQVMDAPPLAIPTPKPVNFKQINDSLLLKQMPGESGDQFGARLEMLGSMGVIGVPNGLTEAEAVGMNISAKERLRRDAIRQAQAQSLAEAGAEREQNLTRTAAARKEAKLRFFRSLAYEAGADVRNVKIENFTEYHQKKLLKEIELRKMLQEKLEGLAQIQDSSGRLRLH